MQEVVPQTCQVGNSYLADLIVFVSRRTLVRVQFGRDSLRGGGEGEILGLSYSLISVVDTGARAVSSGCALRERNGRPASLETKQGCSIFISAKLARVAGCVFFFSLLLHSF